MYTRPDVSFPEFRDDAGAVIAYGDRWGVDGPPEDSYSVVHHGERFQVAWTLARALVDHLVTTYDVDVIEDASLADGRASDENLPDVRGPLPGAPAAVRRLVPRGQGAPLTVVESDLPGVVMLAGVTLSAAAPTCGCDACDDRVEDMADELEEFAFAVAQGTPWEMVADGGVRAGFGTGSSWGTRTFAQRRELRALIREAPAFAPWPLRRDA